MTAAPEGRRAPERRTFDSDRQIESLYRRFEGDVYGFALRLVGRREDAEDVTQVAFLNAYRALERGSAPRRPRAWLLAIARNVCMRRFRQQQCRPREVQLDPEIFESQADGSSPTAADVRSALEGLSSQQRSALLLREFQELSYAEIASRLELSVPAVETLLFRARRALRVELEKAGVTPSVPARRRRVLGGLLPWPLSLEKLSRWLESLGRGGFVAKAAGITATAVIGTGVVLGPGIVPFGRTPAGEPPPGSAPSTVLAQGEGPAAARGSAGRPSARAPLAVGALLAPPIQGDLPAAAKATPAAVATSAVETAAAQGSTVAQPPTPVLEAQLPSLATPSPSPELALPELEAPSLAPEPSLEPSLPEPPELPPPPELEPPELPLPPPPELPPLSESAEPVVETVSAASEPIAEPLSEATEPVVESVTAAAEPPPPPLPLP